MLHNITFNEYGGREEFVKVIKLKTLVVLWKLKKKKMKKK